MKITEAIVQTALEYEGIKEIPDNRGYPWERWIIDPLRFLYILQAKDDPGREGIDQYVE